MSRAALLVDFELQDPGSVSRMVTEVGTLLARLEKAGAVNLGNAEVSLHTAASRDRLLTARTEFSCGILRPGDSKVDAGVSR